MLTQIGPNTWRYVEPDLRDFNGKPAAKTVYDPFSGAMVYPPPPQPPQQRKP
jgi:hypothetical protein